MPGRRDERFEADLTIRFDQADARMRNVSASGVYFVTDADVQPGQAFTFTMEFTGVQVGRISARCEARVVRVAPEGAKKGVGAAFENIEFQRLAAE